MNKHTQFLGLITTWLLLLTTSLALSAELDGATGNIYKVDPEHRTFELLKETEYDPKTFIGQSRFKVSWTDKTTIVKLPGKEPLTPADLAKGYWKTTVHGSQVEGNFVISAMEVTALIDPRTTDNPKLPRVLIIGDSISMNYHEAAKAALKDVANFHRIEGNASSTVLGARNIELWLGDYREKGLHWDVIQFNHGLHDLKQAYDKANDKWGDYAVSLKDYQANLEKEIAILKQTGARLIWCSTTPVPNDIKSKYARRKGAEKAFNQAALEVIQRHPEIQINDLCKLVDDSPLFDRWRKGMDVHFNQKEEQKTLGEGVAAAINRALEVRK